MTLGQLALSMAWLPLLLSPQPAVDAAPDPPEYVDVTITASGYEPATVFVNHGDVVRFVQRDGWAHNIEFKRTPDGAGFAPEYIAPPGDIEVLRPVSPTARVGPMLIGVGRVYEIRIGGEMPPGEYVFGCSHHSKWRGRLIVGATR